MGNNNLNSMMHMGLVFHWWSALVSWEVVSHETRNTHSPIKQSVFSLAWNATGMKSTKVQTLSTVALHATTDCTDDASIVGLVLPCFACCRICIVFCLTQGIRQLLDIANGACKEVRQARI